MYFLLFWQQFSSQTCIYMYIYKISWITALLELLVFKDLITVGETLVSDKVNYETFSHYHGQYKFMLQIMSLEQKKYRENLREYFN